MNTIKKLLAFFLTPVILISNISINSICTYADNVNAETVNDSTNISLPNNPLTQNGTVTWDCIWFGNYWQEDTNGDGICISEDRIDALRDDKQPIKWRVLSIDASGNALLLADKNLEREPFDAFEYREILWKDSTIRSFLNSYGSNMNTFGNDYSQGGFKNYAFNSEEQKALINTSLENKENPIYGSGSSDNTSDSIFLLSLEEATNIDYGFQSNDLIPTESNQKKNKTANDATRISYSTNYVINRKGSSDINTKAESWWLRTWAGFNNYGCYVDDVGSVNACLYGNYTDSIRPAIRCCGQAFL